MDVSLLKLKIGEWAEELGFDAVGVARLDAKEAMTFLDEWLAKGRHGEMDYMSRNRLLRIDPSQWVPGALTVLSLRIDYLPMPLREALERLDDKDQAAISLYALGRDYHKVVRQRLQKLATRIHASIGPFGYRVFSDSAPVFEKSYASAAGLGWIGKHTNLIDRSRGSFFFLGEIVTDLPLPIDAEVSSHCGSCTACMTACPTAAIVAPYQLDARRCISYLTIEFKGSIPLEFRDAMGNRVYGCDDCQLVCPWNRYAQRTREKDFEPRNGFDHADLIELFSWEEEDFNRRLEGSPIRRIGYLQWLRNIAVGLGNASADPAVISALTSRRALDYELLQEHIDWALNKQISRLGN
jgi:epoxyqueuosine reductase